MNRRLLISLCIAGALAFACGPRSQTDASTALRTMFRQSRSVVAPAGPSLPRSTDDARRGENRNEQTLAAQFNVTVQSSEVLFVLNVTNDGPKRVEVNFPSGQTYDFVVVDSTGKEVWHWAQGRKFTQALRNRLLSRGQSIRISERWPTPELTGGHYTAIAKLRSSNYPVEERVAFSR